MTQKRETERERKRGRKEEADRQSDVRMERK